MGGKYIPCYYFYDFTWNYSWKDKPRRKRRRSVFIKREYSSLCHVIYPDASFIAGWIHAVLCKSLAVRELRWAPLPVQTVRAALWALNECWSQAKLSITHLKKSHPAHFTDYYTLRNICFGGHQITLALPHWKLWRVAWKQSLSHQQLNGVICVGISFTEHCCSSLIIFLNGLHFGLSKLTRVSVVIYLSAVSEVHKNDNLSGSGLRLNS